MYIARFTYDVRPVDRERALDFIQKEAQAAQQQGITARLLVPVTRGASGGSLQFEIELTSLDQLEQFRHRGVESSEKTGDWMRAFSAILLSPPAVDILRIG